MLLHRRRAADHRRGRRQRGASGTRALTLDRIALFSPLGPGTQRGYIVVIFTPVGTRLGYRDGMEEEWQQTIRGCEEAARAAFLAADLPALDRLWADGYAVNSPLQTVLGKQQVLGLLRSGRIRHSRFDVTIEHVIRHDDTVVVMGSDVVADPPDGTVSHRRFTNVWQLDGGQWRSIARHAHVVSREPASERRAAGSSS